MIRDLAKSPRPSALIGDVLVIGGGTVGLVLAQRLSASGKRVIVLESGDRSQKEPLHPLNDVVQLGDHMAAADVGRYRCLGGTSTRWGGALSPIAEKDVTDQDWPLELADLDRFVAPIEKIFGLAGGDYDLPNLVPGDYVARFAKMPNYAMRNVATALGDDLTSRDAPEIWLNATVTDFALDASGKLKRVIARAPCGAQVTCKTDEIVLAAGGIESTRLLLLLDRQHNNRVFEPDDVLGRYLHDHLSASVARVGGRQRVGLNRLAAARFSRGGSMRNIRFEMRDNSPLRRTLSPHVAYFDVSTDEGSAYSLLRDMLRRRQQGRLPIDLQMAMSNLDGLAWLARAGWWRFVERRLLYPAGASIELKIMIEQEAIQRNCIRLSDARDSFGQPKAEIDWRITGAHRKSVYDAGEAFLSFWGQSGLAGLAELVPLSNEEIDKEIHNGGGRGGGRLHPGGTIRMGRTPRQGVVDPTLRCFRVPNLHVVSTAVFPTAAGTNPTMTLLMLALRKAESLAQSSVAVREAEAPGFLRAVGSALRL